MNRVSKMGRDAETWHIDSIQTLHKIKRMDKLGNITLYNADCMEIMKGFSDKQFDLAIVDPPYGISSNDKRINVFDHTIKHLRREQGNRKHTFCGAGKLKNRVLNINSKSVEAWDIIPSGEYFNELFRVSKNQIIWGGNYFDLPPTRCIICWDKQQPFENFSGWEMAWTSFDYPAAMFRYRNAGDGEKRIHPTQKPVDLYKWLLSKYAKQGQMILDTHSGSGSICIAAHDLGFELTGIEINDEYYNAAKKRLFEHQRQLRIFDNRQDSKIYKKEELFV